MGAKRCFAWPCLATPRLADEGQMQTNVGWHAFMTWLAGREDPHPLCHRDMAECTTCETKERKPAPPAAGIVEGDKASKDERRMGKGGCERRRD